MRTPARLSAAVFACVASMSLAPGSAGARDAPRAPSGPPLRSPALPIVGSAGGSAVGSPGGSAGGDSPVDEASSAAPSSPGDALASNGLDSPFCREPADLPVGDRANCEAARFAAGPYPTGNYMFDVNIDTGAVNWSNNASAVVQNLAQLGWMALVSLTHGLIVMLEWCYSLGLAGEGMMGAVSSRLRGTGLGFTEPLLALALSVAGALAAYHGLIRRRAAETVGRAIATLAMMASGLWVIVNPAGTVGALQRWSDEAGAGTLAVAASGAPGQPRRTLAGGLGQIYGVVVTAPWCYLEFGAVAWCDSPSRLDGRLRAAGLLIAAKLQRQSACAPSCSPASDVAKRAAASSARLLREARTNGELFLALPAEQALRNSVKSGGTLLNVLCGRAESVQRCRGATAQQAEFRGPSGTYARLIGLLLIWMGALGMLLLFGFFALRLLLCGIATIGYLLLAPAAVLVPVFGESGRVAFTAWATRLMTAAVSKLTYSFLLGVALTVTSLMLRLTVLGWWAQWLLLSAFWWTAFVKRHHTLGILPGSGRRLAVHVRHPPWRRRGGAIRRFARHAF